MILVVRAWGNLDFRGFLNDRDTEKERGTQPDEQREKKRAIDRE